MIHMKRTQQLSCWEIKLENAWLHSFIDKTLEKKRIFENILKRCLAKKLWGPQSSISLPLDIAEWVLPYSSDRHVKLTWLIRLINIIYSSLMQSCSGRKSSDVRVGDSSALHPWPVTSRHHRPYRMNSTVLACVLIACQTQCQGLLP